ncbi:phenolic acid decarboxylase [Aliarcobacter butzleri]|uniref:phenolic acid decarboxylase n=1 Tax=Aliarcobacter butzleri TaxID=28197 RepID=UPI00125EBB44|nr:phenolic acid decarboxylase [Aliarcobacter butzleri]MCT7560642.1 phenolic acid decarboxylase [Aliarcobacter butzleri]MCT7627134.1 phenolic acid decarboxylase [Aliarcobacter butzleri]UWY61074.1 phenolic acid decarboxylase [Aliarcobacter butzleri]
MKWSIGIITIMVMFLGFSGCNNTANTKDEVSLVGKIFEYDYGTAGYRVEYKSDDVLHWKAIKGEETGRESDEAYKMQKLGANVYFVSWVEADGLGANVVLNLKDKKVNAFLKIDREIIPLSGTVTIIK